MDDEEAKTFDDKRQLASIDRRRQSGHAFRYHCSTISILKEKLERKSIVPEPLAHGSALKIGHVSKLELGYCKSLNECDKMKERRK